MTSERNRAFIVGLLLLAAVVAVPVVVIIAGVKAFT